jgi:uncharacterized protein (TIGR00645 family)
MLIKKHNASDGKLKAFGSQTAHIIEHMIFGGRWLLAPMYVALLAAILVYMITFAKMIAHLLANCFTMSVDEILLEVLGLLDDTMVCNLIVMIAIGSYSTFVSELKFENGAVKPAWMNHISSGILKTKMAQSVVGVSTISMLQLFIEAATMPWSLIWKKLVIHVVFILGMLALWLISRNDVVRHSEPDAHTDPVHTDPVHTEAAHVEVQGDNHAHQNGAATHAAPVSA